MAPFPPSFDLFIESYLMGDGLSQNGGSLYSPSKALCNTAQPGPI